VAAIELPVLSPRERRVGGCCAPVVQPDLSVDAALDLAVVVKALADPTRLRIVDVLRKSAPEALCQCELLPLFDMSQPALAKHLKVLVGAGVVGSERRGLWAYYFVLPDALKEFHAWLS
jgi:ArsR family transcriptional regulator, arsenate/arsenite/antimonite-responsive transcriptional repressor